ncbi:N-acetyltransferase [Chitinophaga horti]|uniref:N-acetyltransferase n=1 Tax=Chitinophaga horti TaxID=2920382 RepID=A0ABY6IZT2_9BACT|nr:N-acetyltransferase [Chitinophaga horti]UYQ92686.1 N-acetyltransferase [Chitinophaga horti]
MEPLPSADMIVRIANAADLDFALPIVAEMEASAKARGTGISKRDPEAIKKKIRQGKAIIAFTKDGVWAGFTYLEVYDQGRFVSNSGLIVPPAFRGLGVAAQLKQRLFDLCRFLYPQAKLFGITTGSAVMKINSKLGYTPVPYDEITHDTAFWKGCKSCVNYGILESKQFKNCLCTAMLFEPPKETYHADLENHPTISEGWLVSASKELLLKNIISY